MRIMNKDTIALKEKIIAWVDERDKLHVIPLLDDLDNALHELSFDRGYETWYDIGFNDWYSKGVNMTKYKLYKFSVAMYIVPLDEYDYVDEIVEGYFTSKDISSPSITKLISSFSAPGSAYFNTYLFSVA